MQPKIHFRWKSESVKGQGPRSKVSSWGGGGGGGPLKCREMHLKLINGILTEYKLSRLKTKRYFYPVENWINLSLH